MSKIDDILRGLHPLAKERVRFLTAEGISRGDNPVHAFKVALDQVYGEVAAELVRRGKLTNAGDVTRGVLH